MQARFFSCLFSLVFPFELLNHGGLVIIFMGFLTLSCETDSKSWHVVSTSRIPFEGARILLSRLLLHDISTIREEKNLSK